MPKENLLKFSVISTQCYKTFYIFFVVISNLTSQLFRKVLSINDYLCYDILSNCVGVSSTVVGYFNEKNQRLSVIGYITNHGIKKGDVAWEITINEFKLSMFFIFHKTLVIYNICARVLYKKL